MNCNSIGSFLIVFYLYSILIAKFENALCRFLILFVILYMTQRSNFLTNRTIISSLHKLSPGLYQGFIRCVGKCCSLYQIVLL